MIYDDHKEKKPNFYCALLKLILDDINCLQSVEKSKVDLVVFFYSYWVFEYNNIMMEYAFDTFFDFCRKHLFNKAICVQSMFHVKNFRD